MGKQGRSLEGEGYTSPEVDLDAIIPYSCRSPLQSCTRDEACLAAMETEDPTTNAKAAALLQCVGQAALDEIEECLSGYPSVFNFYKCSIEVTAGVSTEEFLSGNVQSSDE